MTPYAHQFSGNSSPHYVYANINYSLSSKPYASVQVTFNTEAFGLENAPYFWQLFIPFANGNLAEIRMDTDAVDLGMRGAEQFLDNQGATGMVSCPANGHGLTPGEVPGCCPAGKTLLCTLGYLWQENVPYTLTISLVKKNALSETWRSALIDQKKHVTVTIGTWRVPSSWGLLEPTQNNPAFVQLAYYYAVPDCTSQPYAHVAVSGLVGETVQHERSTATIVSTYVSACSQNEVLKAQQGATNANAEMGYAWRPGATPRPSPSPAVGVPLYSPLPMPTGGVHHVGSSVKIGSPQLVLAGETGGLVNFPDEQISYLKFTSGLYRTWMSSGIIGEAEGNAVLADSNDMARFRLVPIPGPYTLPVYSPFDPGTNLFDANYAGPGTVTPASNGKDLLMVYHGENHFWNGVDYYGSYNASGPFYCTVGLARSSDDGTTWTRAGAIITGAFRKPPQPQAGGAGACTPSALAVGGYLYAIYSEGSPSGFPMAIARAPMSSDGKPGSWEKYYDGGFSTSGLHNGAFTPLNTYGATGEGNLTFNRYLNAFVLLVDYPPKRLGIAMLTSSDLINWSHPRTIIRIPPGACQPVQLACYPSMISPKETANQITDQTGYVYVSRTLKGVRNMYRYPYAIGSAPLP
ncbi:MAG TPA: hypothetical protein VGF98_03815 [Candidatus Tumulicola sp.]